MCVVRWGVAWGGVDKEMTLIELQREESHTDRSAGRRWVRGAGRGAPGEAV